jgi:hypothetical protein
MTIEIVSKEILLFLVGIIEIPREGECNKHLDDKCPSNCLDTEQGSSSCRNSSKTFELPAEFP